MKGRGVEKMRNRVSRALHLVVNRNGVDTSLYADMTEQ